jgi:hypothetical protein
MRKLCLFALMFVASASGVNISQGGDEKHTSAMEACAKACADCQRVCDLCSSHCAHMIAEGKKEHLATLGTCRDCATVCSAAAQIVARKGPFTSIICTSCADACKRCGEECEKYAKDSLMKRCADECRTCEKACRDMLKHSVVTR